MNLISVVFYPLKKIENKVKQTNWYCNSIPNLENYPGDSWYRKHLERNYDVVNIGSSSAFFCFNYEGFGVKAFNWALKPQSMEYSFKVLKQYFSILKKNGIVLIPFCPFSGLSVDGKWSETAFDKYYYILDRTLIDNYDMVSKRMRHPLLANPRAAIKRLIKDVPKINPSASQCKSSDDFFKSAKKWVENWMHEFNILDLNLPLTKGNEEGRIKRLKTVNQIIDFCKIRDLQPVIVVPPVHSSLLRYFTIEFRKNYIMSFIEDLNQNNLVFLDYLSDERFIKDELYIDSFFMNETGAKAFTKQVLTDLNLI